MNPKTLTLKQIGELLDTLDELNKIGEAVRAHAIQLVHKGKIIPGWEKSFTVPHRAWEDEEEANTALEGLGLSKRDRYSVQLLSPAQAEEKLKALGKWPRKRAAADFADPFAGLLADRDGKPSIKRVSKE